MHNGKIKSEHSAKCSLIAPSHDRTLAVVRSLDDPLPGTDGITLLDTICDLFPDGSDVGTEIIHSIYIKELRAALDLALKELSPKDKTIVELYYYFQLSAIQIAEMNGYCTQNIYTHIDNALWKLRRGKYKALLASFLEREPPDEYFGNGLSSWKHSGMSHVERFVIRGRK